MTHAAFLAAILADPADDTPRLVYADWLDDHARAEFIRVQIELSAMGDDSQGAWQPLNDRRIHPARRRDSGRLMPSLRRYGF